MLNPLAAQKSVLNSNSFRMNNSILHVLNCTTIEASPVDTTLKFAPSCSKPRQARCKGTISSKSWPTYLHSSSNTNKCFKFLKHEIRFHGFWKCYHWLLGNFNVLSLVARQPPIRSLGCGWVKWVSDLLNVNRSQTYKHLASFPSPAHKVNTQTAAMFSSEIWLAGRSRTSAHTDRQTYNCPHTVHKCIYTLIKT